MGTSLAPDQPWQLQLKPEQWQDVLRRAIGDLRQNPRDPEALQAIRDANEALGVYDEAEAASPSERIASGLRGAGEGLTQAALDVPRGLVHAANPGNWPGMVENIPKIPGALAEGISSDDPAQVARTVGNIGGLALPFAKTSRAVGAPTVAGVVGRAASSPFRFVGAKVRGAEASARGQALRNQLLEQQLSRTPRAQQLPIRGEVRAGGPDAPSPRPAPDLLDQPTYMRRAASPEAEQAIMRRALERAQAGGDKIVPAGPTQNAAPATRMQSARPRGQPAPRTVARQQIERLSVDELQQARGLASDNPTLLRMIERELARRAKP